MIHLRKAGCHLAAARTGRGNYDDIAGRFDILVFAEAFIGNDTRNIGRIAFDTVMTVYSYSVTFQLALEINRGVVAFAELRYNYTADVQAAVGKQVVQP